MKLTSVRIRNFRSIVDLTIDLKHGCQALIGIKESGKSNILKALSLIDPAAKVNSDDLRIERKGESEVAEGSVRFEFNFELHEVEIISAEIIEKFFSGDGESIICIDRKASDSALTIKEFIQARCFGSYEVQILDGKRSSNFYALQKDRYETVPGWFVNASDGALSVITDQESIEVPSKGYVFAEVNAMPSGMQPATLRDVNTIIGAELRSAILKTLPKCISWKYSEQYLLPSSLSVSGFIENPDICIPLRSMFELAGYIGDNIGITLKKAHDSAPHRYIQLLRKVQDAATAHVRDVWKDHKDVQIELQPNGDLLYPIISDASVPLNMSNRSDGFKRFVSFLLQISAKSRANQLKGVLILVDEPEIGLHPGGARNLMDELIRVGENNVVIYSTHSIFMVDKNNIDRHFIVQKKNEATIAGRAEKSRIQDDEVLYAAMGYSIFEMLKSKNIIFEGWKDKEVFRVVSDSMMKSDKELKNFMGSIGQTFAEGVKDVKAVSSFLELANRGCLIISDADNAALEKRKAYSKIGAWGKWVTLRDILGADSSVLTGEDLLEKSALVSRANSWSKKYPALEPLKISDFDKKGAVSVFSDWLDVLKAEGFNKEESMADLKNHIFVDLKKSDVSDDVEKIVRYVQNFGFS